MKSINFKKNFKEYVVNGDESKIIRVKLSPDMLDKIDNTLSEIDKIRDEINKDNIARMGRKYGEIINNIFDTDICTHAFDGENPFSVVDGGKLLVEAFFEAFIPILEEDMKSLKLRPEVQKYLEKS
ncbi:MAG: hypothetical protein K2K91_04345 [Ruminococcus sp.]|nr:hypothetical protein [Ruminococcus sp.]